MQPSSYELRQVRSAPAPDLEVRTMPQGHTDRFQWLCPGCSKLAAESDPRATVEDIRRDPICAPCRVRILEAMQAPKAVRPALVPTRKPAPEAAQLGLFGG